MRLTDEEQKMLAGDFGKTVQKCMKVLVALEIYMVRTK
jgi:predicted aconitase